MNWLLHRCYESNQPIEIIYQSNEGIITQRVITIVEISPSHIKAYCHFRKNLRMFKRENILSMEQYKKYSRNGRAV